MDNLFKLNIKDYISENEKNFDIELSYELFGQPLGQAPIVLVNHALTGNSSVTGKNGWWNSLIGQNKLIDTNDFTVLAFNFPGNGAFFFLSQHANTMAHRCEICVTPRINGVLRARLDAGIALPAHIGFDIHGATIGFIDMHDVRWTYIDTMPASIAARHVNKGWHVALL